jgi:hypothetical protein
MLVGSISPAKVTSVSLDFATFYTVRSFRTCRRTRLTKRAHHRLADPAQDKTTVRKSIGMIIGIASDLIDIRRD